MKLGDKPLVIASVSCEADLHWLNDCEEQDGEGEFDRYWERDYAGFSVPDLLEFRLDQLPDDQDLLAAAIAATDLPLLLTARSPEEGGAGGLSLPERLRRLRALGDAAVAVDLELQTLLDLEQARDYAQAARGEGMSVIASLHDFQGFPGAARLQQAEWEAKELPVDVLKVAVTPTSLVELWELTEWALSSSMPFAAMGMGEYGKLSRLILAKAGSRLNYGYLRTPNAPGQWSALELRLLINEI